MSSYCQGHIPGADKSLARPGMKQARKHVRDARDLTTSRRELSSSFFLLQGKTPKEIHAILTETLAYFLPGRAKDLAAPLYLLERHGLNKEKTLSRGSPCYTVQTATRVPVKCSILYPSFNPYSANVENMVSP